MRVTKIEPCPVCGNEYAKITHGVRDGWNPENFLHLWDCPDCGESHPTVCYDCQECEEAEAAYMAMCDVGHV